MRRLLLIIAVMLGLLGGALAAPAIAAPPHITARLVAEGVFDQPCLRVRIGCG